MQVTKTYTWRIAVAIDVVDNVRSWCDNLLFLFCFNNTLLVFLLRRPLQNIPQLRVQLDELRSDVRSSSFNQWEAERGQDITQFTLKMVEMKQ